MYKVFGIKQLPVRFNQNSERCKINEKNSQIFKPLFGTLFSITAFPFGTNLGRCYMKLG
jgi:hypothetical protein